jgi:hypothetical protein
MEAVIRKRGDYASDGRRFPAKIAECTHNIVMQNLTQSSAGAFSFFQNRGRFGIRLDAAFAPQIFEHIHQRHPFAAEQEIGFHLLLTRTGIATKDCEEA